MTTFYFVAGLPRSGSTLLCNILNQNPRFYASGTSGVSEVMRGIRDGWNQVDAFRAMPEIQSRLAAKSVLSSILPAFYRSITERKIVFDKSRAWPNYIETLDFVLDCPVRVLACVRNVADILASLEKIHRTTSSISVTSQQLAKPQAFQTLEGRCNEWIANTGIVGSSFVALQDVIQRGHRDKIMFVEYESLTLSPKSVLSDIHDFLNEEKFNYDFENVQQVTREDDRIHGFVDLHKIKPEVTPQHPQWPFVLGELGRKYTEYNFWKNNNALLTAGTSSRAI